jgi:hypothetical protein
MTKRKSRLFNWVFIPVIFSFILLAAHFSRKDLPLLSIIPLALIPLLFIRRKYALWIVQLALLAGSAEWVRSTFRYIEIRQQINDDWTLLAIILFSVALFTLISGLLLFLPKVQRNYSKIT